MSTKRWFARKRLELKSEEIDFRVSEPSKLTRNGVQIAVITDAGMLGPTGPQGPGGPAATIAAGTTTTSSPGTLASVSNVGTSSAAIFNFTIPKGEVGAQGSMGLQGNAATVSVGSTNTGSPGSLASVVNSGTSTSAVFDFTIPSGVPTSLNVGTTTTGSPGTQATVVNSGTPPNAIFDFTIPRGNTGPQGIQGPQGNSSSLTIGSTNTGAPGTLASVANSGTSSNAIFDFVIPQGTTGSQGIQGIQGIPGTSPTVNVGSTTTGSAGSLASVVNSGSSTSAILDFTIPAGSMGAQGVQGIQGTTGLQGPQGNAATIGVGSTSTGAPGTLASVTNSGTSSAATFNFTIPRGDVGATGSTGSQGPQGIQGATGSQGPSGVPTALAAIGSTPNANGMTLSGTTLLLQPSNGSFGGVNSTLAQTYAGVKKFTNGVQFASGTDILNTYDLASGSLAPTLNVGTISTFQVRDVSTASPFLVPWSVERVGNCVFFNLSKFVIFTDTGSPQSITFTNIIPTGYRPPFDIQRFVLMRNSGSYQYNSDFTVYVNTGGTVTFLCNSGSFLDSYGITSDYQDQWKL